MLPSRARAEDTLEVYLASRSSSGGAVYAVLLALVAAGMASLPLVQVPVTVRSVGTLRPLTEKQDVRAAVAGLVRSVHARDGAHVRAGEVLVVLDGEAASAERARLTSAVDDESETLADLALLLAPGEGELPPVTAVRTARYQAVLRQLRGELRDAELVASHARRELTRVESLRARGFATAADVDARRVELSRAGVARKGVLARARATWEADAEHATERLADLRAQLERQRLEARAMDIRSPTAGSLELVRVLAPGSAVQAGDVIAIVSPHQPLIAEFLLPPRDVGLVRVGSAVTVRVDALRSREWGRVPARVVSISDDAIVVDGRAAFRVRCTLDARQLVARSGRRFALRKGLTLVGSFHVGRRTLLQLVREDGRAWLDVVASS